MGQAKAYNDPPVIMFELVSSGAHLWLAYMI